MTGFLGNVTAVTERQTSTIEAGQNIHYIRSSAPLYPEDLGMFGPTSPSEHRLSYSRANPYPAPNSALKVANGLRHLRHAALPRPAGLVARPRARTASTPAIRSSATARPSTRPRRSWTSIKRFAFAATRRNTSALPAPACTKQPPQPSIGQIAELTDYTHVYANP